MQFLIDTEKAWCFQNQMFQMHELPVCSVFTGKQAAVKSLLQQSSTTF